MVQCECAPDVDVSHTYSNDHDSNSLLACRLRKLALVHFGFQKSYIFNDFDKKVQDFVRGFLEDVPGGKVIVTVRCKSGINLNGCMPA